MLIAIKDQNLPSMFPNITYDVLVDAGYLPKREELMTDTKSTPEEAVGMGAPKKPRGRPRKKPVKEAVVGVDTAV